MAVRTKQILSAAVSFMCIVPIGVAQHKKNDVPPAPVPVQILSGKRVFLSNLGATLGGRDIAGAINTSAFTVSPTRHYDLFYAALKSWGRYELVSTPAEADLVFEISFVHPVVGETVINGNGHSVDDPQFKLSILDAKSHFVLWTLVAHVETATLPGNRNKNFDQGISDLVQQLKQLVGEQAAISGRL